MGRDGASSGYLLGEPEPPPDQIVLHLDMDCFFAACERVRSPDLRGEPVVIGGGFESNPPRGAVATASYEAREYGVHSAQPISQALSRLPRRSSTDDESTPSGIYLEGDHDYYSDVSESVMEIAAESATVVRKLSIDEAYLDITDRTTWEAVDEYAAELKTAISDAVGVPASIGVAPTMSCAKIACDHGKPDGLTVVRPGDIEDFLAPIPIEDIPGVGPVGAETFQEMDVETAGDLAVLSPQSVIEQFGEHGQKLYQRVRGHDSRAVKPVGKPKSISKEKSIAPTTDGDEQRAVIQTLAQRVSDRVERKEARYRTIGIKAITTPYDVNTRETTLPGPIRDEDVLRSTALDLYTEFQGVEIRKLGVRVSNLDFFEGEQIHLDTWTPPEDIVSDGESSLPLGQARLSDFQSTK